MVCLMCHIRLSPSTESICHIRLKSTHRWSPAGGKAIQGRKTEGFVQSILTVPLQNHQQKSSAIKTQLSQQLLDARGTLVSTVFLQFLVQRLIKMEFVTHFHEIICGDRKGRGNSAEPFSMQCVSIMSSLAEGKPQGNWLVVLAAVYHTALLLNSQQRPHV